MVLGLLLGLVASAWVARAAHDSTLAAALPSPWQTGCLGLGIIAVGWVLANATPRFTAGLAGAATPGALYGALMLAADGDRLLAYGWSAVPISLACLTFGAGFHAAHTRHRSWSARRSTAPRVPRVRTR